VKEDPMIKVYEDADSVSIQLPGEYGPIDLTMVDAAELLDALSMVAKLRTAVEMRRWKTSQIKAVETLRNAAANLTALADSADIEAKRIP
jgi:hypothetical protein